MCIDAKSLNRVVVVGFELSHSLIVQVVDVVFPIFSDSREYEKE